jgi:hypothetical protein
LPGLPKRFTIFSIFKPEAIVSALNPSPRQP